MERSTFRRASAPLFAGALLIAACGDDDTQADADGATETTVAGEQDADSTVVDSTVVDSTVDDGTVVEVSVAGGGVDGGGRTAISLGETVTVRVTSDVADHIHLHGYDVMADVAAGETADLSFEATIPGVFDVELEESGLQLVELEIS